MFFTVHIEELYCFHYTSSMDDIAKSAGWDMFDLRDEYKRMRVPNEQWVLCTANKDYDVCIFTVKYRFFFILNLFKYTFANLSFVIHIPEISMCQLLQHRQCFWEVLVFGHEGDYQFWHIFITIKRQSLDVLNRWVVSVLGIFLVLKKLYVSSQPWQNYILFRCLEDEQMLDCIRRTNPNCGMMYVVDTRPRVIF